MAYVPVHTTVYVPQESGERFSVTEVEGGYIGCYKTHGIKECNIYETKTEALQVVNHYKDIYESGECAAIGIAVGLIVIFVFGFIWLLGRYY